MLATLPTDGKNRPQPTDTRSITKQDLYDAFQLGWTLVELRSRVQVQLNELNTATPPDKPTIQRETRLLEIQPGASLLRGGLWGALLNRIALLHDRSFPDSATAGTLYDLYPKNKRKPWALYPCERPGGQDDPDYADLAIPIALREKQDDAPAAPLLPQFGLYEASRRALNCLILLYLTPDDTLIWDTVSEYQQRLIANMNGDTNWQSPSASAASATPAPAGAPGPASPAAIAAPAPAGAPGPALTATGSNPAPSTLGAPDPLPNSSDLEGPPHDGQHPHTHHIDTARDELTILVVRLLEAWESYLRGQYNRSGLKIGNESRLVALEAGRNMATLSWCLSADIVGHKLANPDLWNRWHKRFDQEDVIRVQRQVAAMGNTLDDLYYDEPGNTRPASDTDEIAPPDPNAPGTVAEAINHSLDYWQRAVEWLQLGGTGEMVRPHDVQLPDLTLGLDPLSPAAANRLTYNQFEQLRGALIEQSNTWQLLLTNQQKLGAYTTETVRFRLQARVFDALEEASTDQLLEGTAQVFNEVQLLVQEATTAVQGIASIARDSLQALLRNVSPFLLLAAVIGVVSSIILLAVFLIPQLQGTQSNAFGGALSGLLTLIAGGAGALGWRNGNLVKDGQQLEIDRQQNASEQKARQVSDQVTNMKPTTDGGTGVVSQVVSTVRTIASDARQDVEQALTRGLKQVQIETRRMDYGIGLTAPLVEFFLFNFNIEGDYSVLTDVLWSQADREEELQNIERAAFGPLSLLLGARRGSGPLSATIMAVTRTPGTNSWVVTGTVRGKELKSWQLYVEPRKDGAVPNAAQRVPLIVSNPQQAVLFGRLGEFDPHALGLAQGAYTVTLVASGQAADGVDGHEMTAQSSRWVDIPDLTASPKSG